MHPLKILCLEHIVETSDALELPSGRCWDTVLLIIVYPYFRLISWTGRKIDPVGVDYILQKLGFHHARTTIPKWLQRGVMDPLDKVLSVLIKKLGTALQHEKEKKGKDKEEH